MSNSEAVRPVVIPEKRGLFFRGRGLIGALILFPAFFLAVFSKPIAMPGAWESCLFFSLGWVSFIVGASFRFWSTLYVGGRKRLNIVQEGPYSICRNPLYLGSMLIAASTGFFLESLTFTACVGLATLAYVTMILPAEEADLRVIHGQSYEEYCQRVPRLIPRFRLFSSPPRIEVTTKGLRLELKRAWRWALLPIACQIISECRVQEWWPHWGRLW